MDFKTGQTLTLTGMTAETLRHWKQVLAPLRRRDGRAAGFTLAEVLALAMVQRIVHGLGIPVSRLAEQADEIFTMAQGAAESDRAPLFLFWTPERAFLGALRDAPEDEVALLVRIDLIRARLREDITRDTSMEPRLL